MVLARTSWCGGKVLLVDDMRLNRLVLGRMLQKLGLEVVEAENGLVAIDQFISHQPALCCVLLDLQMPVLDGWETAKRLRGLEASSCWSRVPIVGCTALGLEENWHNHNTVADSAISCGFDALLEKMPTLAQLLEVLCKFVSGLGSINLPLSHSCSPEPSGELETSSLTASRCGSHTGMAAGACGSGSGSGSNNSSGSNIATGSGSSNLLQVGEAVMQLQAPDAAVQGAAAQSAAVAAAAMHAVAAAHA